MASNAQECGEDFLESDTLEMKEVWGAVEILKELKCGILDTNNDIEQSVEKLKEMKLSNEYILDIIDQNIKRLKNRSLIMQEEVKTKEKDAKLESANDFTSIGSVMDETEEVLVEGQEKVKKNEELLHENQRGRVDIAKEILKVRIQLGRVAEEIREAFEVDTLAFSAVKTIGGKQMVAPVRVKPGNQVRLSHFAEGAVPPRSLVIKHEDLMDTYPRRAFLDLAIGGTFLGRIVVLVMDEGNLALNFLHMCAGDLGPSYANSRLSGVDWKGREGEHIYLNGCEISVMNIDWNKEEQREIYKSTPWKAGDVRGWFSDGSASEFFIFTRDHPNWSSNSCFGIVEEGLEDLRVAISQYPDFTAVRIVDCGLMFSL